MNLRTNAKASTRRERLHPHERTNGYLHCLAAGASVVDPGDLDTPTEQEFENRVADGTLLLERNHGRRVWKRSLS
jgi:hypothetical protein